MSWLFKRAGHVTEAGGLLLPQLPSLPWRSGQRRAFSPVAQQPALETIGKGKTKPSTPQSRHRGRQAWTAIARSIRHQIGFLAVCFGLISHLACAPDPNHAPPGGDASQTPPLAQPPALPSEAQQDPGVPTADQFGERHPDTLDLRRFYVRMWVGIDAQALEPLDLAFWPEVAPLTVRNFMRLCRMGFYDGMPFHRIVPDLMVQGGCLNGDGTGGSPFGTIPGEFHNDERYRHRYGTLSMARGRDRDSGAAQFFVVCHDGPKAWSLDGNYATFGQVVGGGSTLLALRSVERVANEHGERSRPVPRVWIRKAIVVAGAPPQTSLEQPELEPKYRWGPPNTVTVESLMVTYGDRAEDRSEAQARKRVAALAQRLESGTPFRELIRESSEDPLQQFVPPVGPLSDGNIPMGFHFARTGSDPLQGRREALRLNDVAQAAFGEIGARKRAKQINPEEAAAERDHIQWMMQGSIRKVRAFPQSEWPDLASRAFELEVGESAIVTSRRAPPYRGVYLIRRVESLP